MVLGSNAWDLQGVVRSAYKLTSSANPNVAIAQMAREAKQGISIIQAAVRLKTENQEREEEAVQFCLVRGMQVLRSEFLTRVLFII